VQRNASPKCWVVVGCEPDEAEHYAKLKNVPHQFNIRDKPPGPKVAGNMGRLFLIAAFYLSLPPELVLAAVCWHLYERGYGWSSLTVRRQSAW
jgi:hypothetical protein